jgi:hypothetical protein
MKQHLKYIIPVAIVLAGIFFFVSTKKTTDTVPGEGLSGRKVEPINKLPIKDRPYVTLTPRADGREVTLMIDNVFGATSAEYELEYQAESLIQGVFGTINLTEDQPPVSKDLLFGSCSRGKCRFDEGVTGGSLTIRFEGKDEPYVLKSDFNLQLMGDRQGVFTSKDIKAKLDVAASLPSSTFVIIANTMGLPAEVEGDIIAGPYAFLAATSPTLTGAELTIQSKEDLTDAQLLYWTGTAWSELTAELAEGKITAPVTNLGTYVLVK